MIVEINLLGKKEKRNIAPILILAFFLITSTSLGIYAFMVQQSGSTQLTMLEQKLQSTTQLIQIHEQNVNKDKETTAVEDLKTTIEWAKTFPTPTVYLIRRLTELLPERGFIMNFSYSDDGSLNLTVQTDTNREMAYYLKSLIDTPFLSDVQLSSMTTTPMTPIVGQGNSGQFDSSVKNKDYVPRYNGQFQLKVNKEALKLEAAKEGNEQ